MCLMLSARYKHHITLFFVVNSVCSVISSAVVNKSKMLSAGVADVVLKFLQSEMPPVQFKLLGTLRMLIDTQGKRWLLSLMFSFIHVGTVRIQRHHYGDCWSSACAGQ